MPIYKMDGKKDGRQQYRVRINYTDSLGKRRQIDRVAYGSAEAKLLEMQLKNEYGKGTIGPANITVAELVEEYLEVKKYEIRETSLAKTKHALEAHIVPIVGTYRLDKLTNRVLQEWKNTTANKDLALITKQHIYSEFRTMLNYAVKMGYIAKNNLVTLGNFREVYFEKPQDKLQYYTSEQFLKYIRAAKSEAERKNSLSDWGYYVFFAIAYYTGMRKGEINALKWSDIDGDIIHVRRSIAQKLKGADVETPPKNKSSYRDLQAPKPLLDILNEHKKRYQQIEGFDDDFRICGGEICLRDTSIENRNQTFAKIAGLPHIRIHDFRHSHATLLANNAINIQEIARRLGHSNIEMTWNTYSHLYPKEEERAVDLLNDITI